MKKKLELKIELNSRKKLEFRQTLECLSEILLIDCSDLNIQESLDGDIFTLSIQWESTTQMRQALRTKEFSILTGAIKSLAKSTGIFIDDKNIGNDISKLMTL
jgi:transcriptional/translational regulatory protein YebC/TACO1